MCWASIRAQMPMLSDELITIEVCGGIRTDATTPAGRRLCSANSSYESVGTRLAEQTTTSRSGPGARDEPSPWIGATMRNGAYGRLMEVRRSTVTVCSK